MNIDPDFQHDEVAFEKCRIDEGTLRARVAQSAAGTADDMLEIARLASGYIDVGGIPCLAGSGFLALSDQYVLGYGLLAFGRAPLCAPIS
jgi:hypothetical protein